MVTTATDLYSYGLLLQEIFTGQRAHLTGGSADERLGRAKAGESVAVGGVDPDLGSAHQPVEVTGAGCPTDRRGRARLAAAHPGSAVAEAAPAVDVGSGGRAGAGGRRHELSELADSIRRSELPKRRNGPIARRRQRRRSRTFSSSCSRSPIQGRGAGKRSPPANCSTRRPPISRGGWRISRSSRLGCCTRWRRCTKRWACISRRSRWRNRPCGCVRRTLPPTIRLSPRARSAGRLHFLRGDLKGATPLLRDAAAGLEAARGADSLELAGALSGLGVVLQNQGQIAEARSRTNGLRFTTGSAQRERGRGQRTLRLSSTARPTSPGRNRTSCAPSRLSSDCGVPRTTHWPSRSVS